MYTNKQAMYKTCVLGELPLVGVVLARRFGFRASHRRRMPFTIRGCADRGRKFIICQGFLNFRGIVMTVIM